MHVNEKEPRIASHDDDPTAPFADRLLLALGIWPRHAEQVGDDGTLEAVVRIRTAAHRYPMVVEDYGTVAEEREALRAALAARPQADEFWLRARELARECYTPRGRKHAGPLLDYILASTDHEAVAGPATPTGSDDTSTTAPPSNRAILLGSDDTSLPAVAGPATPTEEDDDE